MEDLSILFDDEHISVIFNKGESDYLLITFGDSLSIANGFSFFADKVASKLNLNCIGIMPKQRNWYPKDSILKSLEKINNIIKGFERIVSYGGSMGGYAAIKYSKEFCATTVIALCPQWSIDPEECEGNRSGYEKYFSENLKGMGVISNDISGDVVIIYDRTHKIDSYHADKLFSLSGKFHSIEMPLIGHHVTSAIAGTERLKNIINLSMERDWIALGNHIEIIRKSSSYRKSRLVDISCKRWPLSVINHVIKKDIINKESEGIIDKAIAFLLNEMDFWKINSALLFLKNRFKESSFETLVNNFKFLSGNGMMDIKYYKTVHQRVLAYDMFRRKITQVDYEGNLVRAGLAIPITTLNNKGKELVAIFSCGEMKFLRENNGLFELTDGNHEPPKDSYLEVERKNSDIINITLNGKYVCAEKSGAVSFDRSSAKDWESFRSF